MSEVAEKLSLINDFIKKNSKDFLFYELVGITILFPVSIIVISYLTLLLVPSVALPQVLIELVAFIGSIIVSGIILRRIQVRGREHLESMFRWSFMAVGMIFVVVLILQLLGIISLMVSLSLQLGLLGACAGIYVSLSLRGLFLLHEEHQKSAEKEGGQKHQNEEEGELERK